MHGPPGGRRPIDEATDPQGRGEWFRSGRWLAGVLGGAIAGLVLGGFLWAQWLGPILLP